MPIQCRVVVTLSCWVSFHCRPIDVSSFRCRSSNAWPVCRFVVAVWSCFRWNYSLPHNSVCHSAGTTRCCNAVHVPASELLMATIQCLSLVVTTQCYTTVSDPVSAPASVLTVDTMLNCSCLSSIRVHPNSLNPLHFPITCPTGAMVLTPSLTHKWMNGLEQKSMLKNSKHSSPPLMSPVFGDGHVWCFATCIKGIRRVWLLCHRT